MQSVPESRQQSFEEIYGPPENFLEIEVSYMIHNAQYPPSNQPPTPIPHSLVPTSLP